MSILSKLRRKKSQLLLGFVVRAGGVLIPQSTFAEDEYVQLPYEYSTNEEMTRATEADSSSAEGTAEKPTEESATTEGKANVETENKSDTEYNGESPDIKDKENNHWTNSSNCIIIR